MKYIFLGESLHNLIMIKTKRDCDVHTLSTEIRREWSRLCNSSTEVMAQLYDDEMYQIEHEGKDNGPSVGSEHLKEMMITKERPLGCDDQTMEVRHISSFCPILFVLFTDL